MTEVTDIYQLCKNTEPTPSELKARPSHVNPDGITLTELGKRCGWAVPHQTVYKYATGRRKLTPDRGQEIADATGHPVTVRVGRSLVTMQPG